MSSINTSNSSTLRLYQQLLATNRDNYNTLAEKISAGTNYLKRSDDSSATNQASLVDMDESRNTQWSGNVTTADSWETATYSYLDDITSTLSSAVSLGTEAQSANDSTTNSELATTLESYIETLASDANAKYLGTSLFAGTGTSSSDAYTFTYDSDGNITGATYNGSSNRRSIQTSDTASSSYGTLGSSVFTGTYTDSSGVSHSYDTFDTLVDLRDYLSSSSFSSFSTAELSKYVEGTEASISYDSTQGSLVVTDSSGTTSTLSDSDMLTRILARAEAGSNTAIEAKTANSASSARLESMATNISSAVNIDETRYSSIMQIDTSKAATDLATYSSCLQASLTLASNLSKYSLVNYI